MLLPGALDAMRQQLEAIARGERVGFIDIGDLSAAQLKIINDLRAVDRRPPINGHLIFKGSHIYDSRCKKNGYSVDDVIVQIESCLNFDSIPRATYRSTILQSATFRDCGNGIMVRDEAVLECSGKHPAAEVQSVIPRGDGRHTDHKQKAPRGRGA